MIDLFKDVEAKQTDPEKEVRKAEHPSFAN